VAKLIRFPAELEAKIAAAAERYRRTFTAQVIWWVERGMEVEEQEGQGDAPASGPPRPPAS
jgi:hypothetical protein